jgi:tetratricopeptide (TPR) repeat protein
MSILGFLFKRKGSVDITDYRERAEKAPWRANLYLGIESSQSGSINSQNRNGRWFIQGRCPSNDCPWRSDERIRPFLIDDFPDDLEVTLKGDSTADEAPWCRLVGYDADSDLFLGKLLNQPASPPYHCLSKWDQIVVTPERDVLLHENTDFMLGWPRLDGTPGQEALVDGIRSYRQGDFGHNEEALEKAIEQLNKIDETQLSKQNQFALHFVLGRCYAERYRNAVAIQQFKAAIKCDSNELYSRISYMAELSLMIGEQNTQEVSSDTQQSDDTPHPENAPSLFVECYRTTWKQFPENLLLHTVGIVSFGQDRMRQQNFESLREEDILTEWEGVSWKGFRWKEEM